MLEFQGLAGEYERSENPQTVDGQNGPSTALSRKNSLFAGSDEGGENWACMASLIETCKLNEVNPLTYMAELLIRLVNGWPQDRIDELMPWCWTPKPDA
jgi:hypothetical protein